MNKLKFFWKKNKAEFIAILLLFGIAIYRVNISNNQDVNVTDFFSNLDCWYSNWFDPILTLGNFFLIIYIWMRTQNAQWENSLENRLTVHFKFGDKYVLSCFNAALIGEHDIRAFGQQIGQQMNKNNRLNFLPGIKSEPVEIVHTDSREHVRYHEIEMQLTEVPEDFKQQYTYWIFLGKKEQEMKRIELNKTEEKRTPTKIWEFINIKIGSEAGPADKPFSYKRKQS